MSSLDTTTRVTLEERLFEATVGTLELFTVYLGVRLALYETLAEDGPLTPDRLARGAGIDPRYAREWLEQQAVAGLLEVTDPDASPADRHYTLPDQHRPVLTDPDDPTHVAPFSGMAVGIAGALDEVVDAYRTGQGVPYQRYGRAFRAGQGGINRPAFVRDLVTDWLPAAGLQKRLSRPGARVADLGCGHPWSTIAIARTFPEATVVGIDDDTASIEEATEHARQSGTDAQFVVADAARVEDHGPFDLILLLEVLHDLARPMEGAARVPGGPGRRRGGTGRGRERRRDLHRSRRRARADDVRLVAHPLSPRLPHRRDVGRARHRHPPEHRPAAGG